MVQPSRLSLKMQSRGLHHTFEKWRSTRESHSGRLCGAQRFSGPFPRLCRTCSVEWCPHQDSHLEPRPLEAAYAMLLHLAGVETGSSGWFRTNTAALTERHPTVRSPRILKWWTRTVTLRLLLGANQLCALYTTSPLKLAVETGAAPAVSSLTRRRVCCSSSRPEMDAGVGVAPTKTGL